jgi:hypothetical protein
MENPQNQILDFTQIESERRSSLELLFIVILLGLSLNMSASALYGYLNNTNKQLILFWIPLLISISVFVLYVSLFLLRPARMNISIPTVLFYDHNKATLSIPKQIHYPSHIRIPLPIMARVYFDKHSHSKQENDIQQANNITNLLQYLLIKQYSENHSITWLPFTEMNIGPFRSGYVRSVPDIKIHHSHLSIISNNGFFSEKSHKLPASFPPKTSIKFPKPGTFILQSPIYKVEVNIRCSNSVSLDNWRFSYGVTSSWFRELSSDYETITAYLFEVEILFTLKKVFWRVIGENWLPVPIRPRFTLQDICNWINNWTSSIREYLDWVDEDLGKLPDEYLATLCSETKLTYRTKNNALIAFGN